MTVAVPVAQKFEPTGFAVRHLSPHIGTEVVGVDLKQAQDDGVREQLRQLLRDRAVLFFTDQNLSPEQQRAATAIWGALPAEGDEYDELAGCAARWQSGVTAAAAPDDIQSLQALSTPPHGADLFWASTQAAYDRLSPALRALADGLSAVHALTPAVLDGFRAPRAKFQWAVHPLVRVHPDTGRRALYVNARFTREIEGLLPTESADLLDLFLHHIALPEHVVRYDWQPGALAVWDNRSSVHYAAAELGSAGLRLRNFSAAALDRSVGAKG